jgi:6-phosphogluconolactonase (cycloisomerase 2 family)
MDRFLSQREVVPGISPFVVRFFLHPEEKIIISGVADDRLFTIHEMSSNLSVQSIPEAPNGMVITYASVSIIPNDVPSNATYAAAEILIPSTCTQFPTSYIYVSNRNTNPYALDPRGDSIAIFEHVINNEGQAKESLVLQNQIFTGLYQIRGMEIGNSENGGDQYLIAGAAFGVGGVAIFRRTEGGKNLELVARNQEVLTRTTFVWS